MCHKIPKESINHHHKGNIRTKIKSNSPIYNRHHHKLHKSIKSIAKGDKDTNNKKEIVWVMIKMNLVLHNKRHRELHIILANVSLKKIQMKCRFHCHQIGIWYKIWSRMRKKRTTHQDSVNLPSVNPFNKRTCYEKRSLWILDRLKLWK